MEYSTYQKNIFDFITGDRGNAIVEAVAGSGKTTTIVEAIKRIPEGKTAIFLAFNKSIAGELKARGVNARTFHSLGMVASRQYASPKVTENKTQSILKAKYQRDNEAFVYGKFVKRVVSLAKQAGFGVLQSSTFDDFMAIVEHHDIELTDENASYTRAIEICQEVLNTSNRCAAKAIDFDDMLYLPVLFGMPLAKFDYVFVDEAQDTNAIQREILKKIMHEESRLIAVGDPAQAIYGFRGADSTSLDNIAREFDAVRFPLSVSYRCGRSIVEYAQQWVSHIEPSETAEAGEVAELRDWNNDNFAEGDLVVCRTTKELISLAFSLIRDQKPAVVMGREIGTTLVTLIRRFKTNDLAEVFAKAERWAQVEAQRALDKDQEARAATIEDRAECIKTLITALQVESENATTEDLVNSINEIFAPQRGAIKLATIHKAKGLEADRVFWLNRSKCPSRWAKSAWQQQQEQNLCYVAATRAKSALYLIEADGDFDPV